MCAVLATGLGLKQLSALPRSRAHLRIVDRHGTVGDRKASRKHDASERLCGTALAREIADQVA